MTGRVPTPGARRFEERNVPPALQGLVSRVLRSGVVLAGVLLTAGIVWEAAVAHGSLLASVAPASGAGLAQLLESGGPSALVLGGVFVLVATPLTRVAISAGLFATAHDRAFTVITLIVLAILGATIAVGVLR
jgi:uncharacterized membrane protein